MSNESHRASRQSSATGRTKTPAAQERLWTKDFIVGTAVNFAISVNYFMLMVVMTAYALEFYDAPAAVAAFCASVFIVGTLAARFASAPLIDRLGRKRVLFAGALLEVAFSTLYLTDISLAPLVALRFLHGFAFGLCSTAIATIVTSIVPARRKGEGIGYYMLSVTLGAAIGPFVGVFASSNFGYDALFALAIAAAGLSVLCTAILNPHEASPRSARIGKEDAASSNAIASAKSSAAASSSTAKASSAPSAQRANEPLVSRFLELSAVPISAVCGLVFFGYSSLLTFLTPYASQLGLSGAASVFFIVYAASMFVTRPFTGRAFDQHGPKPVMIPAFLAFSAGMVVISFASSDWMLLGAALLLGFGVGTVQSCGLAIVVRATSEKRLSVANATFYILLDTGVGVGPILLGTMVPLMGYSAMYGCMAAVGVVAMALFLLVSKHERTRDYSYGS